LIVLFAKIRKVPHISGIQEITLKSSPQINLSGTILPDISSLLESRMDDAVILEAKKYLEELYQKD
jgi:hypothetical protein